MSVGIPGTMRYHSKSCPKTDKSRGGCRYCSLAGHGLFGIQMRPATTPGQSGHDSSLASSGRDDEGVSQGSFSSAGSTDAAGVLPSSGFEGLRGLDYSRDDSSVWDDDSNVMAQDLGQRGKVMVVVL